MSARRPTSAEWVEAARRLHSKKVTGLCRYLPPIGEPEDQARLEAILSLAGEREATAEHRGIVFLRPCVSEDGGMEPRLLLACLLAAMTPAERRELDL